MYILVLQIPIAFLAGWLISRRLSFTKDHFAGQVFMKEKVREQINAHLKNQNIVIRFKDGQTLTAEQLLQFMCYGVPPDPKDESHGVSSYTPN